MLRLTWIYYDLLDLYADIGNIRVIEDILTKNNIDYVLDKVTINEDYDLTTSDIIFMGGGADFEQSIVFEDLLKRKENLMKAILNDTVVLSICGGYQLMGKYYLDANGNKINGLGMFNYYTEAKNDKKRMVGYLKINTKIDGEDISIVGFENHSGATMNVKSILGDVEFGYGNNHDDKTEGVHFRNVFGTYLHGPVLTRNRKFAIKLVELALKKNNIEQEIVYENEFMDKSYEEIINYVKNGNFK